MTRTSIVYTILHHRIESLVRFHRIFNSILISIEFASSTSCCDVFGLRHLNGWCFDAFFMARILRTLVWTKKIIRNCNAISALINIFVNNHVSCENLERKYECRFNDFNKQKNSVYFERDFHSTRFHHHAKRRITSIICQWYFRQFLMVSR